MSPNPLHHRQRGAVLIIALIFLTVLALIGTTSAVQNTQQERMSTSIRNHDLAFQAAETALRAADQALMADTISDRDQFEQDHTIAHDADNTPAYRRDRFNWGQTQVVSVSTALDGLAEQPRYVIERLSEAPCEPGGTRQCAYYRVSARGVGADPASVVILQSLYRLE
ncbi:PilX N-terminal domain-containing pilus assembly protein [Marichromatium gracile]|uniref:pilus assembly PilX family protein n=1 Tax=Marichromatium gracile TaxID=1048 RepID=UPI001F223D2C|nr:PilX N-terminal domain-containing pilus assembly protein [Marichromatium gracile]MCF1182092.1 PilX N-terminal domain-containing pilus assembly protein [Marichromatium gracile]